MINISKNIKHEIDHYLCKQHQHHTCINLHDCHRCQQQHYPHHLTEQEEEATT